MLLGAVERLRDGERSLVTVCAEAGAGKSRLLEEVRSRLDPDVQWLEGRAFPYTKNIPYAPVIDLLNQAAGIDERDSSDEVRAKLGAMVERNLPGDDRAMGALTYLYGLATESAVDLESFRAVLLRRRSRRSSTPSRGGRRRLSASRICIGSTRRPLTSCATLQSPTRRRSC